MLDFMLNSFFAMCGIMCIAASALIVYAVLGVLIAGIKKRRPRDWYSRGRLRK